MFAPYFSVSGFSLYTSHSPWDIGEVVHTHARLIRGQQFWLMAPTFIYATGSPEWSTCPELRLTVNLAFANGARGWFSCAYHNDPVWVSGSCQRTLTGPFLNFSDLWLELDRRMERMSALAPLLLESKPAPLPTKWYVSGESSTDSARVPEGFPPTTSYRLRGPDYNLFFVVSNDVRGMSSLNINIPRRVLGENKLYALSDFVQSRTWAPMDLERHIEMFPGQAQIVLLAPPDVCARCRDELARRLIVEDYNQLSSYMKLARAYDINTKRIERAVASVGQGDPIKDLAKMDRARDQLVDAIYSTPAAHLSRSALIRAASAVCACDGSLCRLVNRGKLDLAKELGLKVVPLARETTNLRLAIREGKGSSVMEQCEDLGRRALETLAEIRAAI
jgi:hypothetical protein